MFYFCPSVYLLIDWSVYLYLCLSVMPRSINQSIYLLSINLSIYLTNYLSINQSINLTYLSNLSLSLSLSPPLSPLSPSLSLPPSLSLSPPLSLLHSKQASNLSSLDLLIHSFIHIFLPVLYTTMPPLCYTVLFIVK